MCTPLHLNRENLDAKSKLRLADEIASKAKNSKIKRCHKIITDKGEHR
jgi:hypothetical protein